MSLRTILNTFPDSEIISLARALLRQRVEKITRAPRASRKPVEKDTRPDLEHEIMQIQVSCGCNRCQKDCHYSNTRLGRGTPEIWACGEFLRQLPDRALKQWDFHTLYQKFCAEIQVRLIQGHNPTPAFLYYGFTDSELSALVERLGKKGP